MKHQFNRYNCLLVLCYSHNRWHKEFPPCGVFCKGKHEKVLKVNLKGSNFFNSTSKQNIKNEVIANLTKP